MLFGKKNRTAYLKIALASLFAAWSWVAPVVAQQTPEPAAATEAEKKRQAEQAYEQARDLMDAKKTDEALAALKRASELDPTSANAFFDMGAIYYQKGDTESAVKSFLTAKDLSPNNPEVYFNLGASYNKMEQVDKAEETLRECLRLKKDHLKATYLLGLVLTKMKRFDDAIVVYQGAISANGSDWNLHYLLGNSYYLKGSEDNAITAYERALELNRGNVQVANNLGNLYYKRGNYERAQKYYKEGLADVAGELERGAVVDKKFALPFYNLGNSLYQNQQYDEAVKAYQNALKIDANNALAYFNLGNILFTKKQYQGALDMYEMTLKQDPNYLAVHYNIGNTLFMLGNIEKAFEQYQLILGKGDAYNKVHFKVGHYYFEKGQLEKALQEYQAGLSTAADAVDGVVYKNLSQIYLENADHAKAMESVQSALAIDANDTEAKVLMAVTRYRMGDTKGAEEAFQATLRQDSKNAAALFGLGALYFEMADYTKAQEMFDASNKASPNMVTLYNVAQCLNRLGQQAKAADSLNDALRAPFARFGNVKRKEVAVARIKALQGDFLFSQGDMAKAVSAYEEALGEAKGIQAVTILNNLALAHAQEKNYDKAHEALKRALGLGTDTGLTQHSLGHLLTTMGKDQEAVDAFTKAVQADAESFSPRYGLAAAYFRSGRYAEAIPEYEAALRILGAIPESERVVGVDRKQVAASITAAIGQAHYFAGQLEPAIQSLEQLKGTPEEANVKPVLLACYARLGDSHLQAGDFEHAVQFFKKAIDGGLGDVVVHNNIGVAYFHQGNGERARASFDKAVELDGASKEARNNAAVSKLESGQIDAAKDGFEQLVSGTSAFVPALRNLGIYYDRYRGQPGEAIAMYEKYVAANGTDRALVEKWIEVKKQLFVPEN
ncbi:MAG: tetratricopeptide repeat protein [Candidatus Schekmanbacteria bacterium]|nr:tetratricopeptide repeat protein [Candidatus Schekmanbacteria bacterium]